MAWVVDLIREFGLGIVFLNVLVEQLGAPIPAYPVLVVTGALEGASLARLGWLTLVAVGAALIADVIWYQAGKRYGHQVLGRICRISLSPDACIRQTESVYGRWGAKSLLVAKFVPGFASIARSNNCKLLKAKNFLTIFSGRCPTLGSHLDKSSKAQAQPPRCFLHPRPLQRWTGQA